MTANVKAFGEVMMRLEVPGYKTLEQTNTLHTMYTGTGINILGGLSTFNHHTSIITKLPANSLGNAAASSIRSLGISDDDIIFGGHYIGQYFLENGYGPRASKVIYSNRKESSFSTSEIEEYDLGKILDDTDILHICGIGLAISDSTRHNAIQAAKTAYELGIRVAFDCNFRPKLWNHDIKKARQYYESILPYVNICFMTEKDAKYILGYEPASKNTRDQIDELIPEVATDFGIDVIAGTIREESSHHTGTLQGFISVKHTIHYTKMFTYDTLDRIGSGDGFASGILHGILTDLPAEETIAFGTAAGVLAHTIYGDTPRCTEEDIWNFLSDKGISMER